MAEMNNILNNQRRLLTAFKILKEFHIQLGSVHIILPKNIEGGHTGTKVIHPYLVSLLAQTGHIPADIVIIRQSGFCHLHPENRLGNRIGRNNTVYFLWNIYSLEIMTGQIKGYEQIFLLLFIQLPDKPAGLPEYIQIQLVNIIRPFPVPGYIRRETVSPSQAQPSETVLHSPGISYSSYR